MAWFRHYYYCEGCDGTWIAEWSGFTRGRLPLLSHARCLSLSHRRVIEAEPERYVVLASRETAEDDPDYRELGTFPTKEKAVAFLAGRC